MTTKETAIQTLTEFFTHLGGRQPFIQDSWDGFQHISADKHVGKRRYKVSAIVSDMHPELVRVTAYDFRAKAKRMGMFTIQTTPELAAKFTLEAIDAYEAEMEDAA